MFLGSEGRYHFCGFDVWFRKGCIDEVPPSETSFRRRLVHVLHQRYLYTFAHEMAHAIAFKVLAKCSSEVNIYQGDANGCTDPIDCMPVSYKIDSICAAIGPMGTTALAGVMLVSSLTFRNYLFPLWFTWGAIVAIKEEIRHDIRSGLDKDGGDFGGLAKNSFTHLAAASVAQIGILALSLFAAYRAI